MAGQSKEIDNLVKTLQDQHNDLRVDNSYNLLRASAMLNRNLNSAYSKINLKQNQVILLSFLLANGGTMTPTELKKRVFRSNNAISKSLDGLDKLKLTRSSRSKKDRRLRRVTLTEKGLEVLTEILPIRYTVFASATDCLNEKEAKAFQVILEKLEKHLISLEGKKQGVETTKFLF